MLDALTAVQDHDPYPYYAGLTRDRPLAFDADLSLWVAASAETVTLCLEHAELLVRPAHEPVPQGLVGTSAGRVYGGLVRMREGTLQHALKAVIVAAFSSLDTRRLRKLAYAVCRERLDEGAGYNDVQFTVPARVVASLCGFTTLESAEANRLIADFVQCLPAAAGAEQQRQASLAAERLLHLFHGHVSGAANGPLLAALLQAACAQGWPEQAALLENAVGFLSQTYDATAGLIGNALVTLSRQGGWPDGLAEQLSYVEEVARYDAPIQNTRRFAARDLWILGQRLRAGDQVLVLLAAANRDPLVNAHPDRFIAQRTAAQCFTFSHGRHRCPGSTLAVAITCGVLNALLENTSAAPRPSSAITYVRSANARIPRW
ncbi:cytochrome P450 [Pseudomonas sp. S75]|uniref:cytochrome P450 n=1 Tax=unclassified Pseudomonas TaxID=196821 RepID=UPI001908E43E|nr:MULTISPECIES: cytochrome P450 [unclassified Pseudomonas]MBJ9977634.1 cytochrome P450 [Pseudomonas sp. S30]MBK0155006.1 cytochrome P450 [Pseudomonas sp. S75]